MNSYKELELPETSSKLAPKKKKKGCLFYACIIFTCMAVIIYILVAHGILSFYKFHVTDESGKPLQGVVFYFKYDRNLNLGGKHDSRTKRIKLCTDRNGNASYFGFVKYRPGIRNVTFDGYYENKYCSIQDKTIVLRKKKNPVPMYINDRSIYTKGKKNYNIVFPDYNRAFDFDLIKQDFLPPYGKGEVSDFTFCLKSKVDRDKRIRIFWDIIFSDKRDGMQVVYNPLDSKINYSTFRGPYAAPKNGYFKSYRLAQKNFIKSVVHDWNNPNPEKYNSILNWSHYDEKYNSVYCFKVRSESGTPLYGKIRNTIGFNGLELCRGKFELYLQYYLNPDGTRNLEHSYNLFKTK